ncbi:MAG: APC family permease [Candidatus Methanofastidiosia archaeon]
MKLTRSLSSWYLFAMATGAIIGPWLVMMQWWISLTGPSIALSFVVVGLMCVPIGLVYGEMTAMLPFVGGPFVFIQNAFGKETSYWASWSLLLSYTTVLSFQLMSLLAIIQYLWLPAMTLAQMMTIAAIIAISFAIMNSRELIISATAQFIMFIVLVVVAFTIMALFVAHPTFSTAHWHPFFQTGTGGFFTATALMVTMFFGFEIIPQFAEEAKYPVKNHWKLLVGSVLFCMVLYGGLCIVNCGMMPFDQIIETEMVSATIAGALYGRGAQYAIALANFFALATCLNGFWLASSRLLYSMGRARILPRQFDRLNKHHVPSTANWTILAVVLFFIAISGTDWLPYLFTLMAIGVSITYTVSSLSFIHLRNKYPNWKRPWKVPGGVATGVLAVVCGLLMCYYTVKYFDSMLWKMFIIYYIIGFVVWLFLRYERSRYPEEYVINVPTGTEEK